MRADSEHRGTVIVLTGGPGGGKSALIKRCAAEPALASRIIVLEETICAMHGCGLDPRSPEFQCRLVATQIAAEQAHKRIRESNDMPVLITHRGTLDPCAFWQSFGHSRESFFTMTSTTVEEHYRRYDLVLHLESAAARVPEAYLRYPQAHRPESIAQAARLDELLGDLWSQHPRYFKIEGTPDIETKLIRALQLLRDFITARPRIAGQGGLG